MIIYHGMASSQSTSKYVLRTDGVQNIARGRRRFEFIILRSVRRYLTIDKNRNASSHSLGSREATLAPRTGSRGEKMDFGVRMTYVPIHTMRLCHTKQP